MTTQQSSINEKIEKDRIDNLYQRSKTASLTLLVISAIYVVLLTNIFDWKYLSTWYLALVVILWGRWRMAERYAKDQGRNRSLSFWLSLFRFGIFAAGLTIGSLNLFFFSKEHLSFLLLALIFPFGIMVGAVTMLLDFYSFFIYVITLMAPVIYQTILTGDRLYMGTGFLVCILSIFVLRFSKEYNKNFTTNTRLRYENKALLDDLEEEKNTLNNRLGRILNDSTTEIFVADAKSFRCLQVNQGAIDNLGYSKEQFTAINLLQIFTELDKDAFSAMLAPLYNGRVEPIVYRGISRRKDGSTYPIEASIQISTEDIPPIIVANVQDITQRTEWEKKLIYQANFDQLSGLYNRHYIQSHIPTAFSRARRFGRKVALLFADLDNFKHINDTLGHKTGDEVLKETARRILSQLRESDTTARTGGDEFTILLENLNETGHAEVVARKLIEAFKTPFMVNDHEVYTTLSIGISVYPDDGDTHSQLMQCADMAMYQAKEDGRNTYRFFSQEMRRISKEQMRISNHLRFALANEELSVCYQPKYDINREKIIGAEALLRWQSPELGNIPPVVFIPLAENLGIINEIGTWVLVSACREANHWQTITDDKLHVAVNVSPQQFRTGTLMDAVEQALASSGLPIDQLELEITESLLMQDSDTPLSVLENLHKKGVRLALDDFGTGYSSLSYLRRFPLQILKIDRSFMQDLQTDQNHRALVDAIIAMAHSLKLEVVAEGVENNSQLDFLRQRGVKMAQGYFFSPPVSAEKFRNLLS